MVSGHVLQFARTAAQLPSSHASTEIYSSVHYPVFEYKDPVGAMAIGEQQRMWIATSGASHSSCAAVSAPRQVTAPIVFPLRSRSAQDSVEFDGNIALGSGPIQSMQRAVEHARSFSRFEQGCLIAY